MGNKITTIVSTFIILLVFMLAVAFISTDTQIDESKRVVQNLTETVQYKGYITYDQYEDALNSIPFNNVKLNITHIMSPKNNTIIAGGSGGSTYEIGTLDMRFMSQIMNGDGSNTGYLMGIDGEGNSLYSGFLLNSSGDIANQGIYKFSVGDEVKIDLVITENTFFDTLASIINGANISPVRILTSESGVIVNAKY